MEYYSTIKRKEILPFATTWMDLKGIMLSEMSQPDKDKYCMISLICEYFLKNPNSQIQRTDWWLPEVGSRGGGCETVESGQKKQPSSYKVNSPG